MILIDTVQNIDPSWTTYFITLLTSLPVHAQILIVIFILPIGYVLYKVISDKVFRDDAINFVTKLQIRKKGFSKNDLLTNDLFLLTNTFKIYLNNITFDNKDKDWLFDTILLNKMYSIQSNSRTFISNLSDDMSSKEIKYKLNDLVSDIVTEYETNILKAYTDKYGNTLGKELYEYVYINGFKPYHETNVTVLMKTIELICDSNLDVNLKVNSFLITSTVALHTAIYDCERVFKAFNGHIIEIINNHN